MSRARVGLLLALFACSCRNTIPYVVVTVTGSAMSVASLAFTATLGGDTGHLTLQATHALPLTCSLELPSSATGEFDLTVEALDAQGQPLAEGQGSVYVGGPGTHRLTVPLSSTDVDGGVTATPAEVEMLNDEALGPFASWGNVMTKYGAKGDGITDDTSALQAGLNDINSGAIQVLYMPAGTYKITASLMLNGGPTSGAGSFGPGGAGIIGADPATTTIKWFGPSGGAMLQKNGGLGYRFHRLTWDGSANAGYGITEWWNTSSTFVAGGATEHVDEVFENMNIGIMAGRRGTNYGTGDGAGVVRRVTFLNDTSAGFDTGSFQAVNWWIWESQFINCGRGVANNYGVDDSGPNDDAGAGWMSVYRSLFKSSMVADFSQGNTGIVSLHDNVSIGSAKFILTTAQGTNPSPIIAQGNRIVVPTSDPPIAYGDDGALMLVDNQIVAQTAPFANVNFVMDTDVLALGNSLTAPLPPIVGTERTIAIDNVMVDASQISTASPQLPATPMVATHTSISEVPSGASAAQIQALIDAAQTSSDPLPILHFGTGTWSLSTTLTVPTGGKVQLVGDGWESTFHWTGTTGPMLSVAGPAHVTVRDMQWTGAATAISVSKADQAGGRIEIFDSTNGPVSAQNLTQTRLGAVLKRATARRRRSRPSQDSWWRSCHSG